MKNDIELNQFKRENFVASQWQRIFPGRLGRLFALVYNAYLTDSIEAPEQKVAWSCFVDRLDRIGEIPPRRKSPRFSIRPICRKLQKFALQG